MIKLSVYKDGNPVSEYEQAKPGREIAIGRAPGCSVRLDEPSISRLHALIKHNGSGWVLERKASFGAVLLNGQEVENAPLQGGEEIAIGPFSIRVHMEDKRQDSRSVPSIATNSNIYTEDAEGRTRVVGAGVSALFRFEPGVANISEFVMDKDVAVFGRASNCDVVLLEKRASRKHLEIRRQGLSFFIKDLGSANGTQVNGSKITETELVPGDVIQIGDSKFQFTIENKEFFAKQDQFLPVPAHLEEEEAAGASQLPASYEGGGLAPMQDDGYDAPSGDFNAIPGSEEPEEKSLIKKALRAYKNLKPMHRYLVLLLIIAGIGAIFGTEDPPPKTNKPANCKGKREFNCLTATNKKLVKQYYSEMIKLHEKKDYTAVIDQATKILNFVDKYEEVQNWRAEAEKELAKLEEEKREREREEIRAKIRKEVEALEAQGKEIYPKALKDVSQRPLLDSIIQQIYAKDPNNSIVGTWKSGLKMKDEQDAKEKEEARKLQELKDKAESAFAAVEKIFKEGLYVKALAAADKLPDTVNYNDKDFLKRVEDLKTQIRDKLSSLLTPLLTEASEQRKEGGDLVKAKELYMQVLQIDSANTEALRGLESIRELLHVRAKRLYAEAILAESISDLSEAKDKFTRCERTAPEGDLYKERCKHKLAQFDLFNPGEVQ